MNGKGKVEAPSAWEAGQSIAAGPVAESSSEFQNRSRARMSLYSGAGAALATLAALALLSRREGHRAVRPVNATSHVVWGPEDAPREEIDAAHTLPGLMINVGSAFFWGAVFAFASPPAQKQTREGVIGRAIATSLAAAAIDYGLVPRRLRPGWELALRPPSVMLALAAMGAGLAAGGLAARRSEVSLSAAEHTLQRRHHARSSPAAGGGTARAPIA